MATQAPAPLELREAEGSRDPSSKGSCTNGSRHITPEVENQTEKNMEREMDSACAGKGSVRPITSGSGSRFKVVSGSRRELPTLLFKSFHSPFQG